MLADIETLEDVVHRPRKRARVDLEFGCEVRSKLLMEQISEVLDTALPDDGESLIAHAHELYDRIVAVSDENDRHQLNTALCDRHGPVDYYSTIQDRAASMLARMSVLGVEDDAIKLVEAVRTTMWLGRQSRDFLRKQCAFTAKGDFEVVDHAMLDYVCDASNFINLKEHQILIRSLLTTCAAQRLRRKGTDVYEPVYTTTETKDFTHAYRLKCNIKTFVYTECGHGTERFRILTSTASTQSTVLRYMEACVESIFPELQQNRTIFSFRNGVYDAFTDTFYDYESIAQRRTPVPWGQSVAAKFHDYIFEHEVYNDAKDPLDIPTPNVDKIFTAQRFGPEVSRVIYSCLGRLVFDVKQKDNFQFVPLFRGQAGTGKSTLLNLATNFYDLSDVGNLQSEHGSSTFPVEHIYDKLMYVCMDMSNKHSLGQTTFFSMTSGEFMAVNRKNLKAEQLMWKAPGAFASNGYPNFQDQGGNVTRRFLVVNFSPVAVEDTGLEYKCRQEIAPFLKKCVALYHQFVNKSHQHPDNDNVGIYVGDMLPRYFHETKAAMAKQVNSLCAFLTSPHCRIDAQSTVPFAKFQAKYSSFCTSRKTPIIELTAKDFENKDVLWIGRIVLDTAGAPGDACVRGLLFMTE